MSDIRIMMNGIARFIGLGLCWVWGYVVFHTPAMLLGGGTNTQLNECYLTSLVSALVTAVALVVWNKQASNACTHRMLLGMFAALAAVVTAFIPFALGHVATRFIVGMISGVGSTIITLSWGLYCGSADRSLVRKGIPLAGLEASIIVVLIHFVPSWLGYGLAVLSLPLAMIALPRWGGKSPLMARIRFVPVASIIKAMRWFLLSVLAYGAALGCFRSTLFEGIGRNPQMGSVIFFCGMATAAAILTIWGTVRKHEIDLSATYRVTMPVMVASLLLLVIPAGNAETASAFLLGCGFSCFDLGAWMLMADIVRRTRLSPIAAFGILRLCSQGGMFLGALLGTSVRMEVLDGSAVTVSVVVLFVAACATTFGRLNVLSLDAGGSPQDNSSLINGFCERFGLTSREADVLAYLLAGRSRDYIERELVLSKSTVKTHVRHIYEKTGVHSQQELLDLAEEARAQSF